MVQSLLSSSDLLTALEAIVGPKGITTNAADMEPWLHDWRGRVSGRALAMVSPASVEEVEALVCLAAANRVPLVPQGGNSSMVAGAIPDDSGTALLVSMRRMRRIRAISAEDNSLVAEAGVILTEVHDAAATIDRQFPLSLGAKGSATVGGLISTNAGGVQVLRYGTMRSLTLGLEAVLADGSRFEGLTPLRKDNRGFDLKHLLIGAEGTLGIVTAATLKLVPMAKTRVTAWIGLNELERALPLLRALEAATGEQVTSFEIMPQVALDLVRDHLSVSQMPLTGRHAWHVLTEIESAREDDGIGDAVENILAGALEAGAITDAAMASNEAQAAAFWRLRESVPEAERCDGGAAKHDVSVPVAGMPRFIEETSIAVEQAFPGSRVLAFGHLGDGNVHFNVRPPEGANAAEWLDRNMDAVNRFVDDAVIDASGSLSAEHGIGQLKLAEFARLAEPGRLHWMWAIKRALDPLGIFNPGKLLPPCE